MAKNNNKLENKELSKESDTEKIDEVRLNEVSAGSLLEQGPSKKDCKSIGITKKKHIFKKDEYYINCNLNKQKVNKDVAQFAVNMKKLFDDK